MSTHHGSLSPHAFKRYQGIDLIFKGYDNEEIADIVEVTVRTVRRWRTKLKDNGE
jgi:transposase